MPFPVRSGDFPIQFQFVINIATTTNSYYYLILSLRQTREKTLYRTKIEFRLPAGIWNLATKTAMVFCGRTGRIGGSIEKEYL